MSVRLDGQELGDVIGQGWACKMGWPEGTRVTVTLVIEKPAEDAPRVYAIVERGAPAPAVDTPAPKP